MCSVTKVTVAMVVIMYELTGMLNFLVLTAIVIMIAQIIGNAIVEGGILEQPILLNGLLFLDMAKDSDTADGVAYLQMLDMPAAVLMHAVNEDMHVMCCDMPLSSVL
ncbi:hypothetical protein GGF43_001317 [Coemansia sp. RSA 2618]|nr:hypothetical protein GGF43_001317 [Coemansia sp. RSA 2618]